MTGERGRPAEPRRLQRYLYARRDAVDDLDGATVGVAWQRLGDAVDFHLAFRLGARLLPVDCLTRGALQAAVLQKEENTTRGPRQPDRSIQAGKC